MAYNLPPPWDSGYALPKNVRDEGIERRAFITKMMPRGTYDQPAVGTGGYAVPSYVMDEGYGQGTFTTKWQPSGSYNGPAVPHWLNKRPQVVKEQRLPGGAKVVSVQPLGADDAPLPALYEGYGAKAADIIISQVSRLPPQQRASVMKSYLNKLDPSLWSRTQTIWKRYVAQGANPTQAFPLALARALSAGIAAEIVATGIRRVAPQTNSLLGLGCYGRVKGAMGDAASVAARLAGTVSPVVGQILAPPGAPHMILQIGGFGIDADTPLKEWVASSKQPGIDSRYNPPAVMITKPESLTAAQRTFLHDILTQEKDGIGRPDARVKYTDGGQLYGYQDWPDAARWFSALGIGPDDTMRMHNLSYFRNVLAPLAWGVNSKTGADIVLHVTLSPVDRDKPWDPSANPLVIKAWISVPQKSNPSWWQSVVKSVAQIPTMLIAADLTGLTQIVTSGVGTGAVAVADVGNAIHDAIDDALKAATCKVLTSQAGPVAGAAAAAYVGAPPQAGVQGAAIGAQMCGAAPPMPVPMPVVPSSSILPLALVAGGVLVTAVLLSKRKKNRP